MRVTNEMISNQVVYNLTQNINRLFKLQNEMSTSKRINRASDDPVGTIKDLSYRVKLAELAQFKSNISSGKTWLESTDTALNDINASVSDARTIAVDMSNDTYDAAARAAAANEVQSQLDKLLSAGNEQLQGKFIFSGYKTTTKPFQLSAAGLVYKGDSGVIEYSIDSQAKVQVNTIGSNLLTKSFTIIGEKSDVEAGIVGTTTLASLNLGRGVDLAPGTFTIKNQNLNSTVTIDVSGATTVNDVITAINTQLTAAGVTNLTASLGLEGNNLRFVATDSPAVSLSTPLVNLNKGAGVNMQPGQFIIRNQSGSLSATIDLTGDLTLGDAINSINTQLVNAGIMNVTASLNAGGTGIDISDTNGTPLGLYVEEVSQNATTAANLGLSGSISPVLNGQDLNPRPSFLISDAPGETTAADLGITGQVDYNFIGTNLKPQLLPTTSLAQFQNSNGIPAGVIKISHGDASITIDTSGGTIITVQDLLDAINNSGLALTASINADETGIQIVNNDPTKTLIIQNADDKRTASALKIAGSSDVAGSMMFLIDALKSNDRESVSEVIGTMDAALSSVLNERASAGAKVTRLDTTLSRLDQFEVNYTKLLSEVEDADLTKLITDLQMQENAYTAALNAAAKIIQPSLLNFIK